MSIVKRGNSKNWYMHFQFDGQIYIRSARTTVKKVAEQMEIEWKAKLHSQQYQGRKQRITLADAFTQYKTSKRGIASYANLVAHETVLCRLLPMKKQIDELTSHDLERFKQSRIAEGVGAEIIKYGLLLIKGTWKFAQKLGYQTGPLEFMSELDNDYVNWLAWIRAGARFTPDGGVTPDLGVAGDGGQP